MDGDPTRLYLGYICITGTTGQCEFSFGGRSTPAKIFVNNHYNKRLVKAMVCQNDATWSYTTTTWRMSNGDADMKVHLLIDEANDFVEASHNGAASATATPSVGVGVDSATVPSGFISIVYNYVVAASLYNSPLTRGYHYLASLKTGNTGATFYEQQALPPPGWDTRIAAKAGCDVSSRGTQDCLSTDRITSAIRRLPSGE